jgi:outer membrane protein assembly factor BamB
MSAAYRIFMTLPLLTAWVAVAESDEPLPVRAQVQVNGQRTPATAEGSAASASMFLSDRLATRRLRLAENRIADGAYDEAIDLLQAVLEIEEDAVAPTAHDPQTVRSLRSQALDLMGEMPPEGRRAYELKFGAPAKRRLDEALSRGDWSALEEVSRRFFHTEAGQEATYRLAVRAQDRGEPLHAALLYARLTEAAVLRFEPQLSLRAAAAWLQAGMHEPARKAAARFVERANARVHVAGRAVPADGDPDQLLAWLERNAGASPRLRGAAWPVFGGTPDRMAEVAPVTLAGGVEWSHQIHEPTRWDDAREASRARRLAETLDQVTQAGASSGELRQPAFHPLVAGELVIFRTLRNIQAVDLATGEFRWQTERPHDVLFDRVLEGQTFGLGGGGVSPFGRSTHLEEYVAQYAWRNLTTGTLATDGRYVYAVEGAGFAGNRILNQGVRARDHFDLGATSFNTLIAYDLEAEGRIAWTAGGPPEDATTTGLFFLGPPLPLEGRLYALAEQDGEVRLVVLDPTATNEEERLLWTQTLVGAEVPVTVDPLRRMSGLSPAFADGVLVCPTGSGAVVGVDLAGQLLLWGYQYPRNVSQRPDGPQRPIFMPQQSLMPQEEVDRWLDAVPHIADGAVYLTPRDSDELHCLDVRDGRQRWKRPRSSGLYVAAVVQGQVLVVGRQNIKAFEVTTGESAWGKALPESETAGRGVRSGELYHLPLATGEIVTLHLGSRQLFGPSPLGEGVTAGNLIAAEGRLISQSTGMVAGFRRLEMFEAELQERLAAEEDAAALALRGEHRLHRGEIEAGLADLRAACAAGAPPRAKRLLVKTLLEGLRSDFASFRHYEQDLAELADDPIQRAAFFQRFAEGLDEAGEFAAAFQAYLRLTDGRLPELPPVRVTEHHVIRGDRLLQVRIGELYADASPADRETMDAAISLRLREATDAEDLPSLHRLASLFRGTPAGAAAFRSLAEFYEARGDRLRQEQMLLRLRDLTGSETVDFSDLTRSPETVGDALEASFRHPYRVEYLPDEIGTGRPGTTVEIGFGLRVVGPVPRDYDGWRFEVDTSRRRLHARDPFGRVRWKIDVATREDHNSRYVSSIDAGHVRFSGHLLVCVVGTRLTVLDLLTEPDQPKVLWGRNLVDRSFGPEIEINRVTRVPLDPPPTPVGFAGAELLLLQIDNTIAAVDALTGEVLWERRDLPRPRDPTGDSEFVVVSPANVAGALVLRAVDGQDVQFVPQADLTGRLTWRGTQVVVWRSIPEGHELACRDLARDVEAWTRTYSESAKGMLLGADEVAVLDPAGGYFEVVRLNDGEALFTAQIEPDITINRFLALRSFGKYVLFTRRNLRVAGARIERSDWRFQADGLAYAFDETGQRLWSTMIRGLQLSNDQPAGLPLLFLTATLRSAEGQSHRAAVLDLRTGRILIERTREQQFVPYEVRADVGTGVVTIALSDGRILLTPSDGPLPRPMADGIEAAQPQPPAGGHEGAVEDLLRRAVR